MGWDQNKDVDIFLEKIQDEEKKMVQIIRQLIFDVVEPLTERLSFGVPFYYHLGRFGLLWPASIKGSGLKSGIFLGFTKGFLMTDPFAVLEKGHRKEVYGLTLTSSREIQPELIRFLILESIKIDEDLARKTRGR
jgi:hypothetical protein